MVTWHGRNICIHVHQKNSCPQIYLIVCSNVLAKCFFITQVGKRGLKVILISVARETNNILTCHSPRLRGEINVAKQGRVPLRFLLGSLMAPLCSSDTEVVSEQWWITGDTRGGARSATGRHHPHNVFSGRDDLDIIYPFVKWATF